MKMSKKNTDPSSKLLWIEELRILAAFAVVVLHVASKKVKSAPLLYEDCYIWLSLYHTITRFGLVCFVMITGALLLRPEKELTISIICKKYVSKILVLFGGWSVVYVIAEYADDWMKGSGPSFSTLFNKFIMGHYHMGYLYMLIGLYLITPLLREITKKKELVEYFIILNIIFYLIPGALRLWNPVYSTIQTIVDSKMMFHIVGGYTWCYLMGHYLVTYELKKWQRFAIYAGGVVGILYGIAGGIYFSRATGATTQTPYNNGTINIFLFASAIFLFFMEYRGKKAASERRTKVILTLGNCTLGVYLMHPLFADRIAAKVMHQLGYAYLWIVIPAIALLIFVTCLLITFLLKKLPFISKYIV